MVGVAAVVVIGLVLILLSRGDGGTPEPDEPPVPRRDHWHAAYGVYVCDRFLPPIQNPRDPRGIHTHNDGLIHIHPFTSSAGGRNATLGVFLDAVDLELTDERIEVPGGETLAEGDDQCNGEPGEVVVKVDDRVVRDGFRSIRLQDRMAITIGFVAQGQGSQLPDPPTAADIDRLDPRTDSVRR
jgi:sulfur carrier protein ThiS